VAPPISKAAFQTSKRLSRAGSFAKAMLVLLIKKEKATLQKTRWLLK
jgi:hypothetical protein